MIRFPAALAFSLCVLGFAPAAPADAWNDPQDAVRQLWAARLTANRAWQVAQCTDFNALHAEVRQVASNTGSGLVVPQVVVRRVELTSGLRQMATALLDYDLAQANAGHFYPANVDGPNNMDAAFWVAQARSPHGNERDHLPAVALGGLNTAACPATAALNRAQTMTALDNANGISNSQRWHCYAHRFRVVGGAEIPLTGYVEITQAEADPAQYPYAAADGRVVFDYVNRRVFFSPAHYRQWLKADFAISQVGGYGCPGAGTCCDPFFEIVR